jgi:hypothetical protein
MLQSCHCAEYFSMVTPIANIRIMFNMRIFKAVRIYYLKDKFITDSLSCPYLIIHHFCLSQCGNTYAKVEDGVPEGC